MGTFNSLGDIPPRRHGQREHGQPGFAVGQRGPGTGVWEAAGHDTYDQRMIALIAFDTAAEPAGYAGIQPGAPDLARLLRRLVDGDPHGRDERCEPRDVVGHECVLQGGWNAMYRTGCFDRRESACGFE